MVDDQDLAGLDPYELMAAESARLDNHFQGLVGAAWQQPSRCAGWTVRDVLGHLTATEDYNRACLDGTVQQFLAAVGAKGATDLATANDIGIREFGDQPPEVVLAIWRDRAAKNRSDFQARDGGNVDSSVGEYPRALAGLPSRIRARDACRRRRRARDSGRVESRATRGRRSSAASRSRSSSPRSRSMPAKAARVSAAATSTSTSPTLSSCKRLRRASRPASSTTRARPRSRRHREARRRAHPRYRRDRPSGACPSPSRSRPHNDVVAVARFKDAAKRERLEAAGITCVRVDLAQGHVRRRTGRCRLRLQLRGREERQVGRRHRRQRGSRRAVARALPRRARVPALLVDRRLRSRRRFAAARDRSARRQPSRDDADVQHQQDRGRSRCARDVPDLRRPDDDRSLERAVRRRRRLARVPPRARDGRPRGADPDRTYPTVQPDPRRRHHRDAARPARRRVGTGDDRQLGRRRGREHRGVDRRTSPGSSAKKRGSTARPTTIGGIPTENSKRRELVGATKVQWQDGMRRMVDAASSPR